MKYETNADLPKPIMDALPDEALTTWRTTFNGYMDKQDDQKTASATAWAEVRKQGWQKTKEGWQKVDKGSSVMSFDDVNVSKKIEERTITVDYSDYGDSSSLLKLIEHIRDTANPGHSFDVVVDNGEKFGFDGDGGFRVTSVKEEISKDSPTPSCTHVNKPLDEEDDVKKTFIFKIADTNTEKRIAFGWSVISRDAFGNEIWDLQNDGIDPEDLEMLAYKYVRFYRDSGERHINAGKAVLIESVVTTIEKQRIWGVPSGVMPIGWWTGFYVMDDAVWEKVKNGEYSAFSIEGTAVRERVARL